MRNETAIRTKWDQHDNETRLDERIEEIEKWKEILEKALDDTNKEIDQLSKAKLDCERALEAKNLPMDVVTQCLATRDGRQQIDLVDDEVERQLKKEKELVEKEKQILQQKCAEAFEQMCVLQEARQQILADLQDKNIALQIDVDQRVLTEQSPCISYKPDPLRVCKGSVSVQNWEDFSRYNKERADQECRRSESLRDAIRLAINQTANDLNSQHNATDFALRKRIHEFQRAKDELEWQKKQTEDEIARLLEDIAGLEKSIREKIPPGKLSQTRRINRCDRPNVELARDHVQYGLADEIKQIEASEKALFEKLAQARHELDGLEKQLHRINEQLSLKNHSLMLDQRCADIRQQLRIVDMATGAPNPATVLATSVGTGTPLITDVGLATGTDTDRNIVLTNGVQFPSGREQFATKLIA